MLGAARRPEGASTVTVGLWARLEAKPGKEEDVNALLEGARALDEVAKALLAAAEEFLAQPPRSRPST